MKITVPWEQPLANGTAFRILEKFDIEFDKPLEDVRILDFGCGFGRYLKAFNEIFKKENLYGTEINNENIIQVRQLGFQCFSLDPENAILPFENYFFDVVFSSNVIEHIPNHHYIKYLDEVKRVLKPQGKFVVGTPNYPIKRFFDFEKAFRTKLYKYYFFDDPTHCNKLSFNRLQNDLECEV
tara:strand:+ start:200 stop:745 length:546 start_codon:yes stop_codon:yes gene_type:complete